MKVEILVVDDEILQLQLLSKIIQRYRPEFSVTAVNQPREALKLLRTGRYNALLTDVKMPEMDGIELAFEPEAVRAIARQAIERKCGARGLRAIIETMMLDTMFDLPALTDVTGCVIDEGTALGQHKPQLIHGARRKARKRVESQQEELPVLDSAEPSVS